MNRILAAVLCAAATLPAQRLSAPRLGWTYDRTAAAIRTVDGMPGAALTGEAVAAAAPLRSAVFAASSAAAVGEDGFVRLISDGKTEILEDAPKSPDLLALSPAGTALLMVRGGTLRIQRTGASARNLDFGSVAAAAVSDDGEAVLVLNAEGLFSFSGGSWQRVANPDVAAFDFRRGSHEAAYAAADGSVFRLDTALASHPAGTVSGSPPVGLRWSADGRIVVVLKDGTAAVVNSETGRIAIARCGCEPHGLFLLGRDLFRLTDTEAGLPMRLLDLSHEDPMIWFVPADGGAQ